jgi:hypothetical protein
MCCIHGQHVAMAESLPFPSTCRPGKRGKQAVVCRTAFPPRRIPGRRQHPSWSSSLSSPTPDTGRGVGDEHDLGHWSDTGRVGGGGGFDPTGTQHTTFVVGWLADSTGATNRHFYMQVRTRPAWHGIGYHSVSKNYFRGSETFLRRSAKTMLDPSRVVMSCSCLCLCVGNANVSLILSLRQQGRCFGR